MRICVFTGPTLSPEEGRAVLDALYLPPVSQGDVYRAAQMRPMAIGIIDGYFEQVPSVWHKEILWAMSRGIHVFGSASMGALRAAELEPFGMIGVGEIYEDYRTAVLEDDDEVAVAHGPADTGYRALSEAMVNIRSTLESAEAAGVVAPATRAALLRLAKDLFYPERSYPLLLERGAAAGLPARELGALRDWLPGGQINRKREDALAMLRVMREDLTARPQPKTVTYSLEFTDMCHEAWNLAGELHRDAGTGARAILLDTLLDELRLDAEAYTRARQGALARFLALDAAQRQRAAVTPETVREVADTFRRQRGLLRPADVERWAKEQHLGPDQFARLMEEEAQIRWTETGTEREMKRTLPDHLRLAGEYGRLLERARDKQRVLESRGLLNPALADVGLTHETLFRWYFETRLGRPIPQDVAAHVRLAGFPSEGAFRLAVLREYCYMVGQTPTPEAEGREAKPQPAEP
jgi:hypothetical protein